MVTSVKIISHCENICLGCGKTVEMLQPEDEMLLTWYQAGSYSYCLAQQLLSYSSLWPMRICSLNLIHDELINVSKCYSVPESVALRRHIHAIAEKRMIFFFYLFRKKKKNFNNTVGIMAFMNYGPFTL